MRRVFSNGPAGDFVCNPFDRLLAEASRIHLAAPYFTEADGLVAAARAGKSVQLLVGLNAATTPAAYLVAEEEQAEPPELIGSRTQRVELRFSVSLVVASAARQAAIGGGLTAAIEAARADVLDALRGWLPDGCDWPVEHRGGRLVASEVGRAVWSDTFAVGFLRE